MGDGAGAITESWSGHHLSRMNAGKGWKPQGASIHVSQFLGFPAQRVPIGWSLDRILSAKAVLIKDSWLLPGLTHSSK